MAKDFSIKDARQLIEQHKVLFSQLEYIISKDASLTADIKNSANDLVMHSSLVKMIFDDCLVRLFLIIHGNAITTPIAKY